MFSTLAKISRSSTLRLKLGVDGPQAAAGTLMGTSGRSPVITCCQRAAALSNASRCVAVIGVRKQSVRLYAVPPPPAHSAAVKAAGVLAPAAVAESVFTVAGVPSTQLPSVAMPLAFVTALAAVAYPPPPVTANVTGTPASGALERSRPCTEGAVGTACPAIAAWLFPAFTTTVAAVATSIDRWPRTRFPLAFRSEVPFAWYVTGRFACPLTSAAGAPKVAEGPEACDRVTVSTVPAITLPYRSIALALMEYGV